MRRPNKGECLLSLSPIVSWIACSVENMRDSRSACAKGLLSIGAVSWLPRNVIDLSHYPGMAAV